TLRYSGAASGGLPPEQVREAEAYAANASSELAVKSSQYDLPGHRGPGHAAIPSLDPSKPIAPSHPSKRYRRKIVPPPAKMKRESFPSGQPCPDTVTVTGLSVP